MDKEQPGFQKRVMSMLAEIKTMLQEQARAQPIIPGQDALGGIESWTGGPCETVEEFGELENTLKSGEKRQQLGDECLPHGEVQPKRTVKA